MKKSLLFMALAAFAVSMNAQRKVSVVDGTTTIKAKSAIESAWTANRPTVKAITVKADSDVPDPVAGYANPKGTLFVGIDENFYSFQEILVVPLNNDISFKANVTEGEGTSFNWNYANGEIVEGEGGPEYKILTSSDTTLTIPAFLEVEQVLPAPTLASTVKGGTKLKPIVKDTTFTLCSMIVGGLDSESLVDETEPDAHHWTLSNANVANEDYVGLLGLSYYMAMTEESDQRLGSLFGVQDAQLVGFVEYYDHISDYVLRGIQAWVVPNTEAELTDESLNFAVLKLTEEGWADMGVEASITVGNPVDIGIQAYPLIINFTEPQLISEDIIVFLQPSDLDATFCPLAWTAPEFFINDNGTHSMILCNFTYNGNPFSNYFLDCVLTKGDGNYTNSWSIGIDASHDPDDVAGLQNGINNLQNDKKVTAGTYDLQGRRVKNTQKGVFIVNGQKIIK